MMELEYMSDLKSDAEMHAGSNPVTATNIQRKNGDA